MTIDSLIIKASETGLRVEDFDTAADALNITVIQLYDQFATMVAKRYLSGELSFELGDVAMTELFSCAVPLGGPNLSPLAWQVYIAFDEGEYHHAAEPVEQQGEVKTRMLLGRIPELYDA